MGRIREGGAVKLSFDFTFSHDYRTVLAHFPADVSQPMDEVDLTLCC